MSPRNRQETTYTDELLADGSVHRRYSDRRQEWRVRQGPTLVAWRDNRGRQGTDELLGQRVVKRVFSNGRVLYGREAGYGRTLWSDGVLTVNRTSFGGRLGAILAAASAGALVGGLVAPPTALTPEQEEELRRQAQAQGQAGGDASGGDFSGGGGYGDWGDGTGGDDLFDDFG
ncbi:hypothetical protein [Wenjunlia vitaminophila]|uniref:hypothetical protein n=1 Tax=Wenjunlia vitaminophila TaxID=76728 RepID=UPI00037C954D|nr:hypothetical protein [Wenjunlia vitaminophila]